MFNPGSTRLSDGSTLLLCRAEDRRGISHLCAARSENGIDHWVIDNSPSLAPDPDNFPEELWGLEDPRITFVPELGQYFVVYTAFGKAGPCVAMASTSDFITFERYGVMMQADDKDAALFPKRICGEFSLIHRPAPVSGAHIWLSYSPDLRNWGSHQVLIRARKGAWWDANKIGLGPPPIETSRGWLVIYHGVRRHASGSIYRVGLALLDLENPMICLRRGQCWIFGPEETYEVFGDVGSVVFPTGFTVAEDGDTLNLYYGAADTSICLATASIQELLGWLDANGTEVPIEVEQS